MAVHSPSVCNRQSSRVKVIQNKEIISKILSNHGGFSSPKYPEVLLVVTTDDNYFIASKERNHPYVDGGIFAMSLLLSLEYVGLAACALNAVYPAEVEQELRETINLPEKENLIMFISVGNFPDKTNVPKSFRYSYKEITEFI